MFAVQPEPSLPRLCLYLYRCRPCRGKDPRHGLHRFRSESGFIPPRSMIFALRTLLLAQALTAAFMSIDPWTRSRSGPTIPLRVPGRDRRERLAHSLHQEGFPSARRRLPQAPLHLAEGLLYGVEVGRVGRQEPQLPTPPLDQLAHPARLVRPEVVHHCPSPPPDPGAQRGPQEPFYVGFEDQRLGVREPSPRPCTPPWPLGGSWQ